MGTEGWYNDEADPAIARWYDGTGWTAHTMVKAEWAGPGEPPPPESDAWFVDGPEVDRHDPALYATVPGIGGNDHYLSEVPIGRTATITAPSPLEHPAGSDGTGSYDDDGDDLEMWGARPVGAHFAADDPVFDPHDDYEYGGYPVARAGIDWNRFAAPLAGVAALVIALIAFQLVKGDGDAPEAPTQNASAVGDIEEAVDRARQGLAVDVTDGDLKALIRGLCDVAGGGAVGPVADDAAIAVSDPSALTALMSSAARGAAEYCPADTAAANGAVDDVVAAAGLQITTTTAAPVDTTQTADATSGASSSSRRSSSSSASSSTGTRSQGGVVRSETRSQSSTNPTGITNSSGNSQDQTDIGNIGNNNQSTSTVITGPPPETTESTESTDTSTP